MEEGLKAQLPEKPKEKAPEKETKQSLWELLRFALMALAIVIPIRIFFAEPFVVSGSSMLPTFENGDYLIVDKISYRLGDPKRNDVVILKYPLDPTKFFIKRIIGLPNETIDIKGGVVTITNSEHKDGFQLTEPYVENTANNTVHYELKNDEYFVMGDNRNASSDSRYWGGVKRNFLTGKAFFRLLPIKNLELFPGNHQEEE